MNTKTTTTAGALMTRKYEDFLTTFDERQVALLSTLLGQSIPPERLAMYREVIPDFEAQPALITVEQMTFAFPSNIVRAVLALKSDGESRLQNIVEAGPLAVRVETARLYSALLTYREMGVNGTRIAELLESKLRALGTNVAALDQQYTGTLKFEGPEDR